MASVLDVIGPLGGVLAGVAWRRWQRGPLRPSWSFQTELVTVLQRRLTDESRRRGIHWLRAVQDLAPSALPRALRGVQVVPVAADGVPCEWVLPPDVTDTSIARAIVYCHGGGYVLGSVKTHRELCARLALATGAAVLSVDYRLAPEHRFPAAHDDVLAAVRWLWARGVTPARTAFAGDSAGGGLALATLLALRDAGDALPAAASLLCPWVDPLADGGSFVENDPYDFGTRGLLVEWARAYADEADITGPRLTPARADLHGLPPLQIQVGELEILRDQILAFAARAEAAGVAVTLERYPEMFHDFQVTASLVSEGVPAVASLGRFLREAIGR